MGRQRPTGTCFLACGAAFAVWAALALAALPRPEGASLISVLPFYGSIAVQYLGFESFPLSPPAHDPTVDRSGPLKLLPAGQAGSESWLWEIDGLPSAEFFEEHIYGKRPAVFRN